ncbi:MAG: tetratricopeptide repeat protein [Flavobacteriales bacterium]|nr:tetratricopeptide repeat protein [Flavobacteriales bacterium]MBL0044066.1 tetratricopeptide repeat protein [Flavobacteriales bacterium]
MHKFLFCTRRSVGLLALPAFAIITVMTSCGGGSNAKTASSMDSTQGKLFEARTRIRAQEDSLFTKSVFDRRGAMSLEDVYLAYAKTNPLDSLTPEYLFRAAGVARTLGEPKKTLELYDRIIKDYSSWKRIADTYYLRAFTIDNDLGQKGEAKTAYEEVINRFPDHKFAADAKQMIENLQYTDAQLIEKFEKMNAEAEKAEAAKGK